MTLIGGIEAGGTKFVCAAGTLDGEIAERMEIPTETPEKTIGEAVRFFKRFDIEALGIGSFGPIDVNRNSRTYGYITTTPKKGWKHFPFLQTMKEQLHVPAGFHTDVNAAALGESVFGAARGLDSSLYMTVGTGIGAGAVIGGRLLEGLSHPEMGHILVQRHAEDSFEGICPYHGACFEGMASGPAIEARYGMNAKELAEEKRVWELEAYYIGRALAQFILILSPEKMILGGGVMKQKQLFPLIREQVRDVLNGYVQLPDLENYIVSPELGDNAGITGALLLGGRALEESKSGLL